MGPTTAISLPEAQIAAICQRHGVRELAVFGSVLTDEFGPESDVDFLVEFRPGVRAGLFRIIAMQEQLSGAIGRVVDVVSRNGLNPIIRDQVLSSAKVIYAE